MAERLGKLLERCRGEGMTLGSNTVQVGEKVSFYGYVINGTTVCADLKKVEVITKFP